MDTVVIILVVLLSVVSSPFPKPRPLPTVRRPAQVVAHEVEIRIETGEAGG